MKNSKFNANHIKKVCENKLEIDFTRGGKSKGKEYNGWYILNNLKTARITVPKGRKNIRKGTYSSMARQLHLSVDQFDRLLECPLTRRRYDEILSKND